MAKNKQNNFDLLKTSRDCLMGASMAAMPLFVNMVTAAEIDFPSAEVAADTFVIAVARQDIEALRGMLGEDFRQLLPKNEITEELKDRFFGAWAAYHALVPTEEDTRMLAVGENGWTLPIPIVREAERWRFDTAAGADLMRIRAIGRNELSAMQAALAYRDAQLEYAAQDHDGDGVLEYAQTLLSSPGKKDGLYWEAEAGEPQSPLGSLFASKIPEEAYHGYHYKILTAQGENAPGGIQNYVTDGNMIGGFALVAWPADYGNTGVMSFMLNRDGILYEANLGPRGGEYAQAMYSFDPGGLWMPVLAEYLDL